MRPHRLRRPACTKVEPRDLCTVPRGHMHHGQGAARCVRIKCGEQRIPFRVLPAGREQARRGQLQIDARNRCHRLAAEQQRGVQRAVLQPGEPADHTGIGRFRLRQVGGGSEALKRGAGGHRGTALQRLAEDALRIRLAKQQYLRTIGVLISHQHAKRVGHRTRNDGKAAHPGDDDADRHRRRVDRLGPRVMSDQLVLARWNRRAVERDQLRFVPLRLFRFQRRHEPLQRRQAIGNEAPQFACQAEFQRRHARLFRMQREAERHRRIFADDLDRCLAEVGQPGDDLDGAPRPASPRRSGRTERWRSAILVPLLTRGRHAMRTGRPRAGRRERIPARFWPSRPMPDWAEESAASRH